jgi:hypothetical protein
VSCGLHVACCIGDAPPSVAHRHVVTSMACATCALLDWVKGGLFGGRAAVRCTRAQPNGSGGVIFMAKGTALFDTVPISGTQAWVRAAKSECIGCEHGGGVVRMLDGDIKFKGGTISNTTAVRERLSRSHVPCRMLMLYANVALDALPRGGHAMWRKRHVVREVLHVAICSEFCIIRSEFIRDETLWMRHRKDIYPRHARKHTTSRPCAVGCMV